MDGSSPAVVASDNLDALDNLDLDTQNQILYWSEGFSQKVRNIVEDIR